MIRIPEMSGEYDNDKKPASTLKKMGFSIIYLLFSGIGVLFIALFAFAIHRYFNPLFWDKTPCTIISSTIDESGTHPKPNIAYTYTYKDEQYTSKSYTSNNPDYSYSEVAEIIKEYPEASKRECLVNPRNPNEAILYIDKSAVLFLCFFLLLPLIFVIIGIKGIFRIWKSDSIEKNVHKNRKPLSALKGQIAVCLIFGMFLTFGSIFGYFILFKPLYMCYHAKKWQKVPCTIIHSKVKSNSDGDGVTYSIDTLFKYRYKGKLYKSDTYDFTEGSSSGYAGKEIIVDNYPPGSVTYCYVNPQNPYQAVLSRKLSWASITFSILPLLFILIGTSGIIGTLLINEKETSEKTYLGEQSYIELKRDTSTLDKIIKSFIVAVAANAIVSMFLIGIYHSFKDGKTDWFMAVFIIPFAITGILLIIGFLRTLLMLFSPSLKLEIYPTPLYPGCKANIRWKCKKDAEKISILTLKLTGEYNNETSNVSQKTEGYNRFEEMEIIKTEVPTQIAFGSAQFIFLENALPPTDGEEKNIRWFIELNAAVKNAPDLRETYTLPVAAIHPEKETK